MRVNLKEGAVVKSRGIYRLGAKNKHLFMELLTNSAKGWKIIPRTRWTCWRGDIGGLLRWIVLRSNRYLDFSLAPISVNIVYFHTKGSRPVPRWTFCLPASLGSNFFKPP